MPPFFKAPSSGTRHHPAWISWYRGSSNIHLPIQHLLASLLPVVNEIARLLSAHYARCRKLPIYRTQVSEFRLYPGPAASVGTSLEVAVIFCAAPSS